MAACRWGQIFRQAQSCVCSLVCLFQGFMSRVEEIEAQIATLSDAERAELRDRFLREDADLWDQQIEADALSGRLDEVFAEALNEHSAGKSTPL